MLEKAKFLGRLAIANAVIAAVITVAFADVGRHMRWRLAFEEFAIAFFITCCISPLCVLLLPRITPPVFARFSFPFNWLIVIAVMLCLAAAGSLFALGVLAIGGYLKPGEILIAWFDSSLKVSLIVTLTLGIFGTAREILRSRLKKATIALRTKERDEAEARRLATEAQFASLESRVQPHFLFNTLNSIAALIPQDPVGAERMTGQLASLLRSSLDTAATPLVPLEQELKIVTDYLEIERVRFGERLRYDIQVDRGLEDMAVPRLSLQTLVENSVKYAVSQSRTGATIHVRARRDNDRVRLDVEDDGPGFESESEPPGHGLALLRERLRMTCGASGTLTVDQSTGHTVVRIEIPAVLSRAGAAT
jgi:two-component system, LytTR family, sensor histidine kinase AlgZ